MLTLCSNCMRQREEGRVETQSCFIAKAPTQHQRWRALSWQKLEKPPFLGNSESTTTSGQRQYCEQSPGTVRLLCSLRRAMLPGVTGKEEMPAAFIHFPCWPHCTHPSQIQGKPGKLCLEGLLRRHSICSPVMYPAFFSSG